MLEFGDEKNFADEKVRQRDWKFEGFFFVYVWVCVWLAANCSCCCIWPQLADGFVLPLVCVLWFFSRNNLTTFSSPLFDIYYTAITRALLRPNPFALTSRTFFPHILRAKALCVIVFFCFKKNRTDQKVVTKFFIFVFVFVLFFDHQKKKNEFIKKSFLRWLWLRFFGKR